MIVEKLLEYLVLKDIIKTNPDQLTTDEVLRLNDRLTEIRKEFIKEQLQYSKTTNPLKDTSEEL